MWHRIRSILPLSLLLLPLLTACTKPTPMAEYTSPEGAILKVPADWKQVTDLVNLGDLQLSDEPHQRYFIVVSEKKDGLRNKTIERYSKFTRESIRDGLRFPGTMGPQNLEIGGMKAIQYEISGEVASQKFYYLHTIVEGKDHLHQLIGWTNGSLKEANWPLLQQITNDFREK